MKKHLLTLITVLTILSSWWYGPEAKASHTMGADLTYECLGGNTYRVTFSFYRDCIGIAAPTSPFINISSASCGQTLGLNLYPRPGTGQEITPACSSSVTTCQGGSFTGIQEWVYDGVVTLPAQCSDWTFSYTLCCRNAAITNINTPSTSTFYIYATLNNTVVQCNNSPVFSNKPVPFLCRGQNFSFNHGAYDSDGDSLTFQLITPKQTATTSISYTSPFTAANPLTSIPATTFNTTTGDISMTPQNLEVTVMAVLVNEYRNGVLIGSVERDLQLTVMNCANNLPSLTGINGTNNFSMTVCANQPACFDIFSNDPDAGQQLTVTWDQGIGGASFTSTSALHPTSTFCWTPTTADIGNSYIFTATVTDDACPYIGMQIYSYTINVVGIQVNAGPDQSIGCSDLATLNAIASGGTPPYRYLWNNGSTMQAITVGAGTWNVAATDGMCTGYDTVVVDMPFIPTAAFSNSTPSCLNAPIQFTDQSTTPGGSIYSWLWMFGDGTMAFTQNPSHQFPGAGTYTVSLVVENTLGCTDTVTQTVVIPPPPTVSFNASNGCAQSPITFNNSSTGTGITWTWNFGDGSTSTSSSPTHSFSNSGTYTVTLTGNAGGCTSSATQTITIYPSPSISAGANRTICRGASVTLTASGGQSYTWSTGSTNSSITVNPTSTTNYIVQGTSTNGCTSSDTVTVVVNNVPNINAGSDRSVCAGGSVTLTATGGNSYTWNPGGMTGSSITVTPVSGMAYTVTGSSNNGCTATDVVMVTVNQNPVANAGPDQNICEGSSATLAASGGSTYNWSVSGGTGSTVTVTPTSSTNYTVVVTSANGCTSTDVVSVNVHQAPDVTLQSFFLCSGNLATLDAGVAGMNYSWSPTGETTQTITINSGGNYTVTVSDAYGCSASSTANVISGNSLVVNLSDVSFCQGDSVVLDPGYPGMTYQWSPGGETSQTLTVSTAGSYGVTVTDPSGCSGSVTVNAQMHALPLGLFNASAGCQGSSTAFTDASSVAGSSITNWSWNFGDGGVSAQQNPNHTYAQAGNYTVSLTVTSASGCVSTYQNDITVNPNPVANFSTSDICQNGTASFNNTSSVSSGNITGYTWNFGDGSSDNTSSPDHVYTNAGSYTVTLTVMTAGGCTASRSNVIHVNPIPTASFQAPLVCEGGSTLFSNTSSITSGSISGFHWDFGDGFTSTQSNPTHTYSNSGTFSTTLTVTSQAGCTSTITNNVNVVAAPTANAGADRSTCPGGSVSLTASGGATYEWSPSNQTSASISVSPSSTTSYTVTVTDANGCSSTDQVSVNILTPPTALASPNINLCSGQSTTLTGSGGTLLSWSPGGSTAGNLTVTPSTTTNYVLTVTDANGCIDRDTVTVRVNPLPVINAGPDQSICNGSSVALHATGASNYSWTPGGSSNATMVLSPNQTTTYVVTGTSSQGCSATDTVQVIVNQAPVVTLSPTFVCQGYTATLDAGNPGSSFQWSTGETTQTISISDSGSYSVIVSSGNGCSSLGSTLVSVGGYIQAFPTSNTVCTGQTATLDAGNPGSNYSWSNGATSQTISVGTAGIYSVTITDPNGCSATLQHQVAINPNPAVQFTATSACIGGSVQFNNQSTVSNGNIQQITWDFGNGISSNAVDPSYSYSNPGTYTATLSVTTNGGCTSVATQQVQVHPLPVADFSTPATCLGQNTSFNNTSAINGGAISSYAWDFGNGMTSTQSSPSLAFAAAGNFTAQLTVVSDQGCRDSIQKSITIYGLPEPQFSATNVCANAPIDIQNNSTSTWGSISQYNWNFGDGTTSTSAQPTHQISNAGSYTISLTTTTVNGCQASVSQNIDVYPNPQASFTAINVCAGNSVTITNSSTVNSGTIYSNYWSFENNGSSSDFEPSPVFQSEGTYNISLVTTTTNGCRDTVQQNVTIHPIPTASFSITDACLNNSSTLVNQSTVTTGSIANYNWNLGDGSSSSAVSPNHMYTEAGTYTLTLDVTSDQGCTSQTTGVLNIFPNPEVNFSTGNVCFGTPSAFLNQSTVPGGSSFSSQWNFSDGSNSTDTDPALTFSQAGQMDATLIVTTSHGCSNQLTQPFQVYNSPIARFGSTDNCEGLLTEFTDLSTSQDGSIVAWMWNFGDGQTSTDSDPSHLYGADGSYTVTLLTTTQFGCEDTTLGPVEIFNQPEPQPQFMNTCAGTPVQFNASGTAGNMAFTWSITDGTSSTDSSFTHAFAQAGTYDVTLTAVSDNGCTGARSMQLEIYPQPILDFASQPVCLNSTTSFSNTSNISSGSIDTFTWNFGDGQTSSINQPQHTYTSAGTFQAILTAQSNHGCVDSVTRQVIVYANPVVQFSTGVQGCRPLIFTPRDLTVSTDGAVTGWLWDFGDGDVSTDESPEHVYMTSGNFNVSLTVVSEHNCQARSSQTGIVEVFPDPIADFEMSSTSVDDVSPMVQFTNLSQGYSSFQWLFGDGATSTQMNPMHVFADTGSYSALLVTVNSFGCRDTAYKTIEVKPKSTLFAPNCFTPNGDGKNDVFQPAYTNMTKIQVWVFDRWGLLLKTFDGLSDSWDGTHNGVRCETDTYVYKIKGTGVDGKDYEWVDRVSIVY